MRELCGATSIDYIYGTEGIAGFIVDKDTNNEATYIYRKNIFGDVTAVYNDDGILQCTYEYDAWGNHVIYDADGKVVDGNSDNIGLINPIRYRGYYFDEETGLYYLKTRYYDPQVGRFMTIDGIEYLDPETINGLNLYAYCNNNPVMNVDPDGTWSWKAFWNGVGKWFKNNWVKLAVGAAFIIGGAVVTFFTAGMGTAGLLAAGSALLASAKAVGISMAVSAGIGAVVGGITGGWEGALQGFGNGLADGFMWGGIFAGSAQILSGGFRIATNAGVRTGKSGGMQLTKNIKILSPNHKSFYENGGTILKIGSNFRFDVGTKTLLHMHFLKFKHFPLGTILSSLIGSIDSIC